MPDGALGVTRVVAAVEPFDEVERAQQAGVLAWLDSTPEVAGGAGGPGSRSDHRGRNCSTRT